MPLGKSENGCMMTIVVEPEVVSRGMWRWWFWEEIKNERYEFRVAESECRAQALLTEGGNTGDWKECLEVGENAQMQTETENAERDEERTEKQSKQTQTQTQTKAAHATPAIQPLSRSSTPNGPSAPPSLHSHWPPFSPSSISRRYPRSYMTLGAVDQATRPRR